MITASRSWVLQYVAKVSHQVAELAKRTTPERKLSQAAEDLIWGITRLDSDRDGKITDEDLEMLIELAYGSLASDLPSEWDSLKDTWRVYDGTLSVEKVLEGIQDPCLLSQLAKRGGPAQFEKDKGGRLGPFGNLQEYVRCFREYDADANGVICSRDLRIAVSDKVGLRFDRERCKEIIRKVDRDGDGVIGLNDFGLLILQLVVEEEEEYASWEGTDGLEEEKDPWEVDFEDEPGSHLWQGMSGG